MAGIFGRIGKIVADLDDRATIEGGSTLRTSRGIEPLGLPPHPIVPPERIDEAAVIAAYERHLGAGVHLEDRLFYGPITPLALIAVLGEMGAFKAVYWPSGMAVRVPSVPEFPIFAVLFVGNRYLGFCISRFDLESRGSRTPDSWPLGIFTGLLLRARRQRRARALARRPFSADDPLVIGPVVRLWSQPLVARTELFRIDPLRDRAMRLARFGGDPGALQTITDAATSIDARLNDAVVTLRALASDPASVHRSPLVATQAAFADLRAALADAHGMLVKMESLRRTLFPRGSLEEPIRLNATG